MISTATAAAKAREDLLAYRASLGFGTRKEWHHAIAADLLLREAIARWLLGSEPFTARLNPDLPGYSDYDQLMRLDEWQGRERANAEDAA